MSIFQGQPLQLPELGLHVAPSKVVAWAKSTLEKVRALPALGQDVNILHLNVGAAMLKAWSVTYSDKPDAPEWAYPSDVDIRGTSIPGYPSLTVGYPTEFQKGGIDIPPSLKTVGCEVATYWPRWLQ